MKILFIAPKYSGGIGGHAARVAEKLQEYGFDVKLMHTSHIPIKKLKTISMFPTYIILLKTATMFLKILSLLKICYKYDILFHQSYLQ